MLLIAVGVVASMRTRRQPAAEADDELLAELESVSA
jgi:hypothetical protein